MAHLGENIAKFRMLKGLKQEVLAKQIGISQQDMSKLERSENIKPEVLKSIAKELECDVDTLPISILMQW
jgi:transcriptional regulator with XRE-family HTH domain